MPTLGVLGVLASPESSRGRGDPLRAAVRCRSRARSGGYSKQVRQRAARGVEEHRVDVDHPARYARLHQGQHGRPAGRRPGRSAPRCAAAAGAAGPLPAAAAPRPARGAAARRRCRSAPPAVRRPDRRGSSSTARSWAAAPRAPSGGAASASRRTRSTRPAGGRLPRGCGKRGSRRLARRLHDSKDALPVVTGSVVGARSASAASGKVAPFGVLVRTLSPCLWREVPPALPEGPGRTPACGVRAPCERLGIRRRNKAETE